MEDDLRRVFLNTHFLFLSSLLLAGEPILHMLRSKLKPDSEPYILTRLFFLLLILTSFGLWVMGPVREYFVVNLLDPEYIRLGTEIAITVWSIAFSAFEALELRKHSAS